MSLYVCECVCVCVSAQKTANKNGDDAMNKAMLKTDPTGARNGRVLCQLVQTIRTIFATSLLCLKPSNMFAFF